MNLTEVIKSSSTNNTNPSNRTTSSPASFCSGSQSKDDTTPTTTSAATMNGSTANQSCIPIVSLKHPVIAKQISESNNSESDLTELSWLTSNHIQLFGKTALPSPTTTTTVQPLNTSNMLPLSNTYNTAQTPVTVSYKQKDVAVAALKNNMSANFTVNTGRVGKNSKLLRRRQLLTNNEEPSVAVAGRTHLVHLLAAGQQQQHQPKSPMSTSSSSTSTSSPSLSPSSQSSSINSTSSSSQQQQSLRLSKSITSLNHQQQQQQLLLQTNPINNNGNSSKLQSNGTNNTNGNGNLSVIKFKNTCGLNKPALTLSCLIFMAIEESTRDKCLPVREIYEWIQENFPYYRVVSNPGWKSSVRHNLSFSKCFRKSDRTGGVQTAVQGASDDDPINRKRRHESHTPNLAGTNNTTHVVGTCWEVNKECRLYLIQTLKKSSFWFHNSRFYAVLAAEIERYIMRSDEESLRETKVKSQHHRYHHSKNLEASMKENKVDVKDEDDDDILRYIYDILRWVIARFRQSCLYMLYMLSCSTLR
jgi:hypothetical protein